MEEENPAFDDGKQIQSREIPVFDVGRQIRSRDFTDIKTWSREQSQFSLQVPDDEDDYKYIRKSKWCFKFLCSFVVVEIIVILVLAVILGVRHDTCKTTEPSEQKAETRELEKAGQISMALTLDHQFEKGMAVSNSTVFEATQTELCEEVHKALDSYKRFPDDTRIVCELDSLRGHSRNGTIKVFLKLKIIGGYTIPDNSMYVHAVTTYIGSHQEALGSFTVMTGSISVLASSYTPIKTTPLPPSTTDAPPLPMQTEIHMKSFVGRIYHEYNITCCIHHASLEWTELRIKPITNDDVQAAAFSDGKTIIQSSSYHAVQLMRHNSTVTLAVIFPNTTASCTAGRSYVCTLLANRTTITSTTAMVTLTDDARDIDISGNSTVSEGDRYTVNCTATLAKESGKLDLFVKAANDSDFVKTADTPIAITDDVVDVCHHSVTKTYTFFAENNQNGTEMKCVGRNDILNSVESTNAITIIVEPADFQTVFHLDNATWIPAYSDVNSPEFSSFAKGIEHDTDYVYNRSTVKDNYKRSKVVRLSQMNGILVDMAIEIDLSIVITDTSNNVIHTELNANDILRAFTQALPTAVNQLPHSALAAVDTKDLVGDVVVDFSITSMTLLVDTNLHSMECDVKTDMIFVLDASGSIGLDNFIIMKYFIKNFTATVDIGTNALQIGVVKFDGRVYDEFWLNTYDSPRQISGAVDQIKYTGGGTYLDAALNYTRYSAFTTEHGGRVGAGRVIIVMTDGASNDDPDYDAAALKSDGVVIVSIGIGNGVNQQQLLSIAYNSSFVFQVNDFGVLINIKKIVQSSTCAVEGHHQK